MANRVATGVVRLQRTMRGLYEASTYGEERRNAVQHALSKKRVEIYSQDAYTASNVSHAAAELFANHGKHVEAVVFIGLDDVFGDVVVAIHNHNRDIMVFGQSKTITSRLWLPENQNNVNWNKVLLTACVPFAATNSSRQMVTQYEKSLSNLDVSLVPSPAGLEGYIVAQIMAISMNSILNEEITVDSLLNAVYDHGVFKVDDLRCGPMTTNIEEGSSGCNQCMREVSN